MEDLIAGKIPDKKFTVNMFEIVEMLSLAIELSSNGVSRHGKRVAYISKRVYENLFNEKAPYELVLSAVLHDIGTQNYSAKRDLLRLFPQEENLEKHSIDGKALMSTVDLFKDISEVLGNHHKSYDKIKDRIKAEYCLYSNIINLADRVDISIEGSSNILAQVGNVFKNIGCFPEGFFSGDLVDSLKGISNKKSFWLDIDNEEVLNKALLQGISTEIELSFMDILQIADLCAALIDRKSPYTAKHSFNVSRVSTRFSRLFGFDDEKCFLMSIAGKFHDIGKLGTPEEILHKPGALDDEERCIIQQHSYYSYHILDKVPIFKDIKKWSAYHHENLDGTGYPFALTHEKIPFESRIIAVADKLIALTEDRPYRPKMRKDEVLGILCGMAEDNWVDETVLKKTADNYELIMDGI